MAAAALLAADAASALARDDILLIGNSFTSGIRKRLRTVLRSSGRDVRVVVRASTGWTLEMHAGSRATLDRLHSADWLAVVLQEQSDGIGWERYPAARALDEQITGRTVFFMTWPDQDDEMDEYDLLRGEPGGDTGYVPIAFELGADVAPVGWVFREALLEEPGAALWSRDGHHAGERGRYLAALALYTAIYRESPVGLWMSPRLSEEQAYRDQLLVERVVLGNPDEWSFLAP